MNDVGVGERGGGFTEYPSSSKQVLKLRMQDTDSHIDYKSSSSVHPQELQESWEEPPFPQGLTECRGGEKGGGGGYLGWQRDRGLFSRSVPVPVTAIGSIVLPSPSVVEIRRPEHPILHSSVSNEEVLGSQSGPPSNVLWEKQFTTDLAAEMPMMALVLCVLTIWG